MASWKFSSSERSWESPLLQDVERSANSWSSWDAWGNWYLGSEFNPSLTLESVPHAVDEFEDVSSMMPVSFIEGPATLGESTLGWTPVVPFAVIESVPDFLAGNPLPSDGWDLLLSASLANLRMSSVLPNEAEAFSLSGEDVFVLSINLLLGLAVVGFVVSLDGFFVFSLFNLKKGVLIDGVHVLAFILHVEGFLDKVHFLVFDILGSGSSSERSEEHTSELQSPI